MHNIFLSRPLLTGGAASGVHQVSGAQQHQNVQEQASASHNGRVVKNSTDSACKRLGLAGEPVPSLGAAPFDLVPTDQGRAAVMAFLGQPLPVNYHPDGHSPLEGLVPVPRQRLTGADLEKDPWLCKDCQRPEYLATFRQVLEERRAVEARHEEFCFAPLKVTLRNMLTFIDHILDGKQFDGPLTARETRAMIWARQRTEALLEDGAPYKRTLCLAMALMTLCEIITDRQVLIPLRESSPEAFDRHVERVEDWSCKLGPATEGGEAGFFSAAALDPLMVAALSWGGNNPGGAREAVELIGSGRRGPASMERVGNALAFTLHNQHLLLYPSFLELDIADFCRFSHLGLHPVGMTTDYALNADGVMMSPLMFASHDLLHLDTLKKIGDPWYLQPPFHDWQLWTRCDQRLLWRCLLLEQIPACLAPLELKTALHLLLFEWFHEQDPCVALDQLLNHQMPFARQWLGLAMRRRVFRNGFAKAYQAVTDSQMAQAVLWGLRLVQCWKTAGFRMPDSAIIARSAQDFVNQDVPRLQAHMDFVAQHRPALRQLFASHADWETGEDDGIFRVGWAPCLGMRQQSLLFASFQKHSGLHHLDYTDAAYFAAWRSAGLRAQMAARFGDTLPAWDGFGVDEPDKEEDDDSQEA